MATARALKSVTATQLEEAFTKGIRELVGDGYRAEVGEVKFDARAGSDRLDITDVSVAIRRNNAAPAAE
jgi:hypothetical protein